MRWIAMTLASGLFIGVTLAEGQGVAPSEQQMQDFARENYTKAKSALARSRYSEFKRRQTLLEDYPLYPYLEYAYLVKRFSRVSENQIISFLEQHKGTPLASRLKSHWLRSLAKQGQWSTYLQHYDPQQANTTLKCHALWAHHKTGNTQAALSEVQPLWLVSKSQPAACDPIFKLWREGGMLTDQLAWQRFTMAMRAGRSQLARYLIRYMSKDQQRYAQIYRELRSKPERVASHGLFRDTDIRAEQTIIYGMRRLARKQPSRALSIWGRYSNLHDFGEQNHRTVNRAIALGFARNNEVTSFTSLFDSFKFNQDTRVIEAGIAMSIRMESWQDTLDWIALLPQQTRSIERWDYWHARALYTLGLAQENAGMQAEASSRIRQIAKNRSYYGFMASDHLNTGYSLNHQSYTLDGNFLERFKRTPAVIRATELLAVGDDLNARREWRAVTSKLNNAQRYTAAHYAHDIGWHSQAIRSAIASERWDDLKLRFPPSFEDSFTRAAAAQGLKDNWLLAVARQESAMAIDARSPKGALGLMQLMPSTAKYVAKSHGLKLKRTTELLEPETNILFGSTYLKQLYDDFGGNVIYATAAYNAGPHRVKSWLKKSGHLPIDIWIENIPFSETRQYVKNVLAFSVIYAHQREQQAFKMATAQYSGTHIAPINLVNPAVDCTLSGNC